MCGINITATTTPTGTTTTGTTVVTIAPQQAAHTLVITATAKTIITAIAITVPAISGSPTGFMVTTGNAKDTRTGTAPTEVH